MSYNIASLQKLLLSMLWPTLKNCTTQQIALNEEWTDYGPWATSCLSMHFNWLHELVQQTAHQQHFLLFTNLLHIYFLTITHSNWHCDSKNCTSLLLQELYQIFLYWNSYWYTYTLLNLEQNDIKIINLPWRMSSYCLWKEAYMWKRNWNWHKVGHLSLKRHSRIT